MPQRAQNPSRVAVAALAWLVGCAETLEPPVAPKPVTPVTHSLSFEEGRFGFDGRTIDFPTTVAALTELLGPPSRPADKDSRSNVWDDLGLRSRSRPGSGQVVEIDVDFRPNPVGFSPKSYFNGEISVPGGRIGECSTAAELHAAGFRELSPMPLLSWSLRLGRFSVVANCDDGVSFVCFAWRGPDVHVPGPPLGPDERFSANSRAYGFPFDEVIREVERRGNVSVLRHEIHGHGGTVGRSMFFGGAVGELARRQGYGFVVVLDDHPVEGDRDDEKRISETIVGFTRVDEPDLASEFPADFDPQRTYSVLPADLVIDALGDWPDGGLPWATSAR